MNWDNIWKQKKYITDFSLRWLSFLLEKKKLLPKHAKVLEAGCGSGEGAATLAREDTTTIGVDISKEALVKTVLHKMVWGIKGDNFALPFPDNTFDFVFNSGVIEHYKYPRNVEQIREMHRVTKPGGEVIIDVPNTLCVWYSGIKAILLLLGKWRFGYEESYTPWRLKRTVEETGLRVINVTGFLSIPPFATNNIEILPLKLRKKLALAEKYLPLKQYYCYSVCVLCKKD